jgi:asparagine synthase (glutamine-hydrolysing)
MKGADALDSLQGDFVLAVIDSARAQTLLAVDRAGIRNLIFRQTAAGLVFASSADALAAHPAVDGAIDPQAIYNYVYFHMVPGPGTVYRGVQRLLPGQCLVRNGAGTLVKTYWEMHFSEEGGGSVADFKPGFVSALREAVAAAADGAPCGAFLSGGTDSSTISGFLGQVSGAPARTFSIGFDAAGYDEMEYARIAARHFGTEHHEYYVRPDDVVAAISLIARIYDQPFGNASAVPTYYCAKLARDTGVALMLGGDGGDELFGGNARYAKQQRFDLYGRVPAVLRQGVLEPLLLGLPGVGSLPLARKAQSYIRQASMPMPARYESYNLLERLGPENVFTGDFLASVDRAAPLTLMGHVYGNAHAHSLINRMLALDAKFTLADNDLPKVTRMCELAGVDVAFPMLHESVVDLSLALPPRLKLKGTRLRYFFKEALRGFLPEEIITKEKHGFGLPVGLWLRDHAPLRALADDALDGLRQRRIVRPEFVGSVLSSHLQAHPAYYGTMIWVLMMLELWFRSRATSL